MRFSTLKIGVCSMNYEYNRVKYYNIQCDVILLRHMKL